MPAIHYPAVIDRSASGFGVSFPDFPGLVAAGGSIQEAAVNAELALALHLRGLADDKDPVPPPSDLDSIEPVEGADDVAYLLVRAEMPGSFSRLQITLEDSLIAAIDAVASNRSGFLANAAWSAIRAGVDHVPARRDHRYKFQREAFEADIARPFASGGVRPPQPTPPRAAKAVKPAPGKSGRAINLDEPADAQQAVAGGRRKRAVDL